MTADERRIRDLMICCYYASGATLEETGRRFGGITRERVRQIMCRLGEPTRDSAGSTALSAHERADRKDRSRIIAQLSAFIPTELLKEWFDAPWYRGDRKSGFGMRDPARLSKRERALYLWNTGEFTQQEIARHLGWSAAASVGSTIQTARMMGSTVRRDTYRGNVSKYDKRTMIQTGEE